MRRLYENSRGASRAASSKDDVRITEMINGQLVSKPAKKIEEVTETKITTTKEPEITILNDSWDREQKSKAASVPVNKLREIVRFQMSNGRL